MSATPTGLDIYRLEREREQDHLYGLGLNSAAAENLVFALRQLADALDDLPESRQAALALGYFVGCINRPFLHEHGWQLDYEPATAPTATEAQ